MGAIRYLNLRLDNTYVCFNFLNLFAGDLMANQIEFKLFAPYNKGAALIGSFSNWEDIPMEKGKDGYFQTKVELEDGVYQYKFRVQSKSWFFEPDQ